MDKAKSKKSDKIPKPIKIKKEKTEENRTLQSMATYVDDRLELIKQIFSTLKPKTIVNLAPEYLKKKKMTKIEELCLTELVRLSKKRLLSIVNATKCPTDTESSEDSDVQPQEAKKKKMTKNNENNSTDAAKNKNNNENDGEGVISVLELLELQARARAIRSQLALEPVTKIEVDAEDPPPPKSNTASKSQPEAKQVAQPPPTQGKEKERRRKRKSQDTNVPTENGAKTSKENPEQAKKPETQNTNKEKVIPPTGKKIKLKRNYRNTNQNSIEKQPEPVNKKKEEVKVERKSHSPSPDVIPILAEPETLTITDSSDEEKKAKIVEAAEKEKGDDGGVRTASVIVAPPQQQQQKEKPLSDIEDGEISDKEPTEVLEKSAAKAIEINAAATKQQQKPAVAVTSSNDAQEAKSVELDENADSKNSVSEMGTPKVTSSVNDENSNLSSKMDTDDVADDDDDQDDVISIEGSDLETEITKHLETEKPKQDKPSQKATIKKEASESQANAKDNNNVSISSGDESGRDDNDAEQQSWRSRYFKSTKVNKVLTASRLGKRVRDKIKKSKSAKKEKDSELANKAANGNRAKAVVFESKHEDGSVEQYKELLESTKRQSDSKKT